MSTVTEESTEEYVDPNDNEGLREKICAIDRNIQRVVKVISLRGDGMKINESIFTRYGEAVAIMDDIGALIIRVSKYEDTKLMYDMLEGIYNELSEIELNI